MQITTTDTEMGKVLTTLMVTNRADQILAEAGVIKEEQVRSLTLKNVLVDTGATTLCLPQAVIAQLGLKILKEVDVTTATGLSKARIFRDRYVNKAKIEQRNRSSQAFTFVSISLLMQVYLPMSARVITSNLHFVNSMKGRP